MNNIIKGNIEIYNNKKDINFSKLNDLCNKNPNFVIGIISYKFSPNEDIFFPNGSLIEIFRHRDIRRNSKFNLLLIQDGIYTKKDIVKNFENYIEDYIKIS